MMQSKGPKTPGSVLRDVAASAERLHENRAYRTVVRLSLSEGATAFAGLRPTGLDISLPDGLTLHYDLEGRLTRAAFPNVQWRRGLSHRAVLLRKRSSQEGGGLESRILDEEWTDRIADETSSRACEVRDAFKRSSLQLEKHEGDAARAIERIGQLVSRAAAFNAGAARGDLNRFRSVYGEIPILPPDQYRALVMLATEGCAYNQCTFCGFYRETAFRSRTVEQFREHASSVLAYHGAAASARQGVFLGQANALTGARSWREDILRVVNQYSRDGRDEPHLRPTETLIASFIDTFTGRRMSGDDFRRLRRLNLRRLYLGVETGDPMLLEWLRKPGSPRQILDTVIAAKSGGINVGVILLVGAGGEAYFTSHVRSTADLLIAMRLGRGDYVYLSPITAAPGAEYSEQAAEAGIEPLSAGRVREQITLLRSVYAAVPRESRPYVAHYEVEQFVY